MICLTYVLPWQLALPLRQRHISLPRHPVIGSIPSFLYVICTYVVLTKELTNLPLNWFYPSQTHSQLINFNPNSINNRSAKQTEIAIQPQQYNPSILVAVAH